MKFRTTVCAAVLITAVGCSGGPAEEPAQDSAGDNVAASSSETDQEPESEPDPETDPSPDPKIIAEAVRTCDAALEASGTIAAQLEIATRINESGLPRGQLRSAIDDLCADAIAAMADAAPEPVYHDPTADDFLLDVVVLEQSCFGSAGCNVRFRVELTYLRNDPLDPEKTYELTYEILGGENISISTMEVSGDSYRGKDRERAQTATADDELTASVVRVSER